LRKLRDQKLAQELILAVEKLCMEPRPHGSRKLSGSSATYRIRHRDYRIVYGIDDTEKIVHVSDIGHRRDIYR
jgi:mRNA interferase RelE/StbE